MIKTQQMNTINKSHHHLLKNALNLLPALGFLEGLALSPYEELSTLSVMVFLFKLVILGASVDLYPRRHTTPHV